MSDDQAAATDSNESEVAKDPGDYDTLASVAAEPPERTADDQWGTVVEMDLGGQPAALCGCVTGIVTCPQHRQAGQPGRWRYTP